MLRDLPVMMLNIPVLFAAAPFARETHHAGWRVGGVVSASRGRIHDAWAAGLVGFHNAHFGCCPRWYNLVVVIDIEPGR